MGNNLQPVNPAERRLAEHVQQVASQTTSLAINELRKADEIHRISRELIDVMAQELHEYGAESSADAPLAQALASLRHAEKLIRIRGNTNGG